MPARGRGARREVTTRDSRNRFNRPAPPPLASSATSSCRPVAGHCCQANKRGACSSSSGCPSGSARATLAPCRGHSAGGLRRLPGDQRGRPGPARPLTMRERASSVPDGGVKGGFSRSAAVTPRERKNPYTIRVSGLSSAILRVAEKASFRIMCALLGFTARWRSRGLDDLRRRCAPRPPASTTTRSTPAPTPAPPAGQDRGPHSAAMGTATTSGAKRNAVGPVCSTTPARKRSPSCVRNQLR